MRFEERSDVTREEYLAMSSGKSAAMFAAPFAIGARLGGGAPAIVEAYREYGRRIGLAFQAVDDILGTWGDEELTGKPVGDDLRLRKMTYPVIAALEHGADAASLREAYATAPSVDGDVEALAALVERLGGRSATERLAEEQVARGLEALRSAGVADTALRDLAEFAGAATARSS
jgi:geranylgeranyl diphosphate synthase type I